MEAPMARTEVDVPGGRLNVVDEGDGPPILLIHAGVADLRAWDDVVPHLTRAGYRVIRHDLRGFGRSTTEDVEFSHQADVRAVLDAAGVERAVLVGNSKGGQICIDTAIESPARVVAVVSVAGGVGGFDGGQTPEEVPINEEYERVDSAEPFDAVALTDFEVKVWTAGPLQPLDRVSPELRTRMFEMGLPLNQPDRVAGRQLRLDPPANDRLDELRCPVLAIAGTLDFSECVATARHLEANAPDARALIWDDVAHMIGLEQPGRLAAAIASFVEPLRPWS
jgi:pimeloyl-ACP methyl ester carboxylesterase